MSQRNVHVVESGDGPYGQRITAGRHVLSADEPEAVGGRDTGADPFELLLAALGACTAMTLRMYATRKQIPLERVEVRLRHVQRAAAGRGGIKDRFERTLVLHGPLDEAQKRHLREIADKCPVSQTLTRSSDIDTVLAESPAQG